MSITVICYEQFYWIKISKRSESDKYLGFDLTLMTDPVKSIAVFQSVEDILGLTIW